MQGYNCIMVFNQMEDKILFCKRTKNPYMGLYNLVGGKIEKEEDGFLAAYRELKEETGIEPDMIELNHMMDFTYYNQDCFVEVYVGTLREEVILLEEAHPLEWLSINENFFDDSRFAGEGNIGHMVEQVKIYGVGSSRQVLAKPRVIPLSSNLTSIGVDGCKGGWIAAILKEGTLKIDRFSSPIDIVKNYPDFKEIFIDMVIGLPSNREHVRPDTYARQIIKERASTIFPAPCRQAVYADTIAKAYEENERILGKKFTPLTVGIIPKIRIVDVFLQNYPIYKNVIKESHPEVCFARLNAGTLLTKKSELDGIEERLRIISKYIPDLSIQKLSSLTKSLRCNLDDIADAICLAITANLAAQGYCETIPSDPTQDETGLLMQMVIPCLEVE